MTRNECLFGVFGFDLKRYGAFSLCDRIVRYHFSMSSYIHQIISAEMNIIRMLRCTLYAHGKFYPRTDLFYANTQTVYTVESIIRNINLNWTW
jgi:hypothetical protein